MSAIANSTNAELIKLNSHFLMAAQRQLSINPITAKHKLGMDEETANFVSSMSPLDIQRMAESGICVIKFKFEVESLPYLTNYINGDDLAITQAVLGAK
jgi:hypothetical protein